MVSICRATNLSSRRSEFKIHCKTTFKSHQKCCVHAGNCKASVALFISSTLVTAATSSFLAMAQFS